MEHCYMCEKQLPPSEPGGNQFMIHGQMRLKKHEQWKDVLFMGFLKRSDKEDIHICRKCLGGALVRFGVEQQPLPILTARIDWIV